MKLIIDAIPIVQVDFMKIKKHKHVINVILIVILVMGPLLEIALHAFLIHIELVEIVYVIMDFLISVL